MATDRDSPVSPARHSVGGHVRKVPPVGLAYDERTSCKGGRLRQHDRSAIPGVELMADGSAGPSVIRRLVDTAWSTNVASTDPDDPLVRGFADFGLPARSPLATEDQLRDLKAWRDNLRIPANSAFLDGTMLLTVQSLL